MSGTDPGGTTSFSGGALVVKKSSNLGLKNEFLAQSSCFFVVCGLWFVVGVRVTLALVNLAVVVVTVTGFGCCWVFCCCFVVVFCCFYVVLLFLTGFACFPTPLFPSSTYCLFFVRLLTKHKFVVVTIYDPLVLLNMPMFIFKQPGNVTSRWMLIFSPKQRPRVFYVFSLKPRACNIRIDFKCPTTNKKHHFMISDTLFY